MYGWLDDREFTGVISQNAVWGQSQRVERRVQSRLATKRQATGGYSDHRLAAGQIGPLRNAVRGRRGDATRPHLTDHPAWTDPRSRRSASGTKAPSRRFRDPPRPRRGWAAGRPLFPSWMVPHGLVPAAAGGRL